MKYYAHSAKNHIEAQEYAAHISGVHTLASRYLNELSPYMKLDALCFRRTLHNAAAVHDLGKLCAENQAVLSGEETAAKLPVHHQDAGSAVLKRAGYEDLRAGMAVAAHHRGYPDFSEEIFRGEAAFRDESPEVTEKTDQELDQYLEIHQRLINCIPEPEAEGQRGDSAVFLRMLLSCLADADHTDTAMHYGQYPAEENSIALRPKERLKLLREKVGQFVPGPEDDVHRFALRKEMFEESLQAELEAQIVSCDSPVGSGKTTAVMANLLAQADRLGLRRIFVVLPFTNIIRQSVDVYRRMLVLPGEKGEDVVAELHHRADFSSKEARHLTALWRAPIIVTTAVAFFETLASNQPSALRRLHELPGSAIFVDESHAALPVHLLPIAWRWIGLFAQQWGCYWVLASGSLTRFWELPAIGGNTAPKVPEIVGEALRGKLAAYENKRIAYHYDPQPKTLEQLADWVESFEGPRLVILNTIQSAAALAKHLWERHPEKVEHLSTALKPSDREATLYRVKKRLKNEKDQDWTLVATSCVEAGVDLSFRNGFRELASLFSLLQAAGRIDREGVYKASQIWAFSIAEDGMLKKNAMLEQSASVLRELFESGAEISPALCTQAMEREIRKYGLKGGFEELQQKEEQLAFRYVAEHFQVIESNARIAIVDEDLKMRILHGQADWKEIQRGSVQISLYLLKQCHTPEILKDIYAWNLEYNDFIGYMAGVFQYLHAKNDVLVDDRI